MPEVASECNQTAHSARRVGLLPGARSLALCGGMSSSAPTPRSTLLLDALGTLVALEPPAPRLRAELAERFAVAVSEEQARAAIVAEIAYYRAHLDDGGDPCSLRSLRERCAEVVRGALPPSGALSSVTTAELTDALLASIRFTAYEDARPAIDRAHARGMTVVVASNWDISLHEVLGRLGLAAVLDGIVTSAEAGACKPAPAVFERALALAGARPSAAIHVGDSLEEDVVGARRAGIEPVLLSRDGHAAPAGVRVILSLGELEFGP
jgi:putative hydrolase of the HAD superfamily